MRTTISGLEASKPRKIAFYQPCETSLERIKTVSPGILQFFAWLEKLGHEVDYFIHYKNFLEKIKNFDIAALSGAEPSFKEIYNVANELIQVVPNMPVVLGGHITKGAGRNLIYHPGIDIVVVGEGEYTFPMVLNALPKHKKSGLTQKEAEKILTPHFTRTIGNRQVAVPINNVLIKDLEGRILTPDKPNKPRSETDVTPLQGELEQFMDLPWSTSYPQYSPGLFKDYYSQQGAMLSWTNTGLFAKRGCAGVCNFCTIDSNVRTPSTDSVIGTLEKTLTAYERQTPRRRPNEIHFSDDSFLQGSFAKELIKKIIAKKLHLEYTFSAQYRVVDGFRKGKLDTETLDLLSQSFFSTSIGVETLDPTTAEYLGKIKPGKGEEYVRMAKELTIASLERGIPTFFYLITLTPNSTLASIANDYLNLSQLAKEAYEKTENTFNLRANPTLLPHTSSQFGKNSLEIQQNGIIQPYSETKRLHFENIDGTFYPLKKEEKGHLGVFIPEKYRLSPELQRFQNVFNAMNNLDWRFSTNDERAVSGIQYLGRIGETLYEASKGNKELQSIAQEIIANISSVMASNGSRKNPKKQRSSPSPYSEFLQFGTGIENIERRLQGLPPLETNPLEIKVQEVIDKDRRTYDIMRTTVIEGTQLLQPVLSELYQLLREANYDFEKFNPDKIKQAYQEQIMDLELRSALEPSYFSMIGDIHQQRNRFDYFNEKAQRFFRFGLAASDHVRILQHNDGRREIIQNSLERHQGFITRPIIY